MPRMFIALALCFLLAAAGPAQQLKIVHFDIGQGTATLIWAPSGQTLLVDAGPTLQPDLIRNYLQAQGITHLNYSLATHYHADHIGEYPDLFTSGYLPDTAWDRGSNPGYSTSQYTAYVNAAGSHRHTINPGQIIHLGPDVQVQAVCVNGHLMNGATYNLNEENSRSICLLLEYHNFRYVVAGDMTGGGLNYYDLETPVAPLIGNVNAVELSHHGSNSSSNLTWLNTLSAEAAFVSLENNNPYGFVHTEVISRVTANPTIQKLYHTEQGYNLSPKSVVVNGNIILTTDGLTNFVVQNDTFWIGSPSSLTVSLVPLNPPITVPAAGGSFQFTATVQRVLAPQSPFYVWSRNRFPDGTYTANLLGPVLINPPVGQSVTRLRTQNVPGTWAVGVHWYIGYANATVAYPTTDADSFSWMKLASSNGEPWISDAICTGEPFPGEEIPPLSRGDRGDLVAVSPNPFNPTTTIRYQLASSTRVHLTVHDVQGRLVATLVDSWQEAGGHVVRFDGSALPSGVYLYTLSAGRIVTTGKLALVK